MKVFTTIILTLLGSLLASCGNMNKQYVTSIEKVWQLDNYKDSNYHFRIAVDINQNKSAYQFLKNGKLKVRQNSSWCGTEPISYETVSGSWNKMTDSTIRLNYPYWGGNIVEDILIKKITDIELLMKTINFRRLK